MKTTKVAKATLVTASIIFISLILTNISYAEINLGTCVGMWLFEGSGNVAKDSSGNENDGKIIDAEWVEGKYNGALSFNGESSVVEIPHSNSLVLKDKFTIEAWIKSNVDSGDVGIISKWARNVFGGWFIEGWPWRIYFWELTNKDWKPELDVPAKEWVHLAFTYDGKEEKAYVNGKLASSESSDGSIIEVSDNPVRIGFDAGSNGEDHWFNGLIDEVAISNVALTEDDIKDTMKGFESVLAVSPVEKLATAWGSIKRRY